LFRHLLQRPIFRRGKAWANYYHHIRCRLRICAEKLRIFSGGKKNAGTTGRCGVSENQDREARNPHGFMPVTRLKTRLNSESD
jgi:hypothetical protein